MDVYRRYFRVTAGPLIEAVQKANEINDAAFKVYNEIGAEFGAEPGYYAIRGRLTGFLFNKTPDSKLFRKDKGGGYYPKKSSKAGQELIKRIDQVATRDLITLLSVVGLSGCGFPRLFGGGKAYYEVIVVIPHRHPVVYINVPWYDENPETLTKYKVDKQMNIHSDHNLDAILWEPTPDMVEVKKWEVDKHISDWNASLK